MNKKTEPVNREAVLVLTYTPSLTIKNSKSETDVESLDKQDRWNESDNKSLTVKQ